MQLNINNSKPESRKKETQFRINDIKEEKGRCKEDNV